MSGSIRMPPGAGSDTLPVIPRQRKPPSWAEPDPIDQLADRLDDFIAAAVHPDEIAALLESDGMSDDQIRKRYGVKNSFALAEELYDRVERRYPEPEGPPHDPWRTDLLACLLRGVVFALPGLGYVLGAPLLAAPGLPLLTGALVAWTWNQALSHRAYSWLSLDAPDSARRTLLLGAPAGALLGTLAALAAGGSGDPTAVLFAAGQSCYLGAATILLVLHRERALLAALLPMTAGATLTMIHPIPNEARALLLLTSLATVAILAALKVTPARSAPKGRGAVFDLRLPPRGRDKPQRTRSRPTTKGPQLAASLPYALFGLSTGILVLYSLDDALALTLSMGPAEYLLHRFRSNTLTALRSTTTPKTFRHTTTLTLIKYLTTYLTTLLTLSLTTSTLWPTSPGTQGIRLTGLLLLGVVLWTSLLLQSVGAVLHAAATCCAAALAQTLALATHAGSPHWVALTVYGTAAGVQTVLVGVLLGRATAHR
ncbi:hypothetical protein [Streptomyces sp. NPDC000878]